MATIPDDIRSEQVERLLGEGLDLYGQGLIDRAVDCWQRVLMLQPDEPRALDYLEAAGGRAGAGDDEELELDHDTLVREGSASREHVIKLLEERRYEEALDLLYDLRSRSPDAPEISRGIQHLKERLTRTYLKQLGSLDNVPRHGLPAAELAQLRHLLSTEQEALLALADGISTFGDIMHASRLGHFETYRELAGLMARGFLVVGEEEAAEEAAEERTPVVAPPVERAQEAGEPAAAPRAMVVVASAPAALDPVESDWPAPEPVDPAEELAPLPAPRRRGVSPVLVMLTSAAIATGAWFGWRALAQRGQADGGTGEAEAVAAGEPWAGEPAAPAPIPDDPTAAAPTGEAAPPTGEAVAPTGEAAVPTDEAAAPTGEAAAAAAEPTTDTLSGADHAASPPAPAAHAAPDRAHTAGRPSPGRRAELPRPPPRHGPTPPTSPGPTPASPPQGTAVAVGQPVPSGEAPPAVEPTAGNGSGAPASPPPAPAATPPPPAPSEPSAGGAIAHAPAGEPAPPAATPPAPSHPTAAAAAATAPTRPAPPAPVGPLDASASTKSLMVNGSLSRAVVERAVSRVVPAFRTCYVDAARRAGHHAGTGIQVALVIDESARATDVSVGGAQLPGLGDCLRGAAGRIRTTIAPDVGVVRVSFALVFTPK